MSPLKSGESSENPVEKIASNPVTSVAVMVFSALNDLLKCWLLMVASVVETPTMIRGDSLVWTGPQWTGPLAVAYDRSCREQCSHQQVFTSLMCLLVAVIWSLQASSRAKKEPQSQKSHEQCQSIL